MHSRNYEILSKFLSSADTTLISKFFPIFCKKIANLFLFSQHKAGDGYTASLALPTCVRHLKTSKKIWTLFNSCDKWKTKSLWITKNLSALVGRTTIFYRKLAGMFIAIISSFIFCLKIGQIFILSYSFIIIIEGLVYSLCSFIYLPVDFFSRRRWRLYRLKC